MAWLTIWARQFKGLDIAVRQIGDCWKGDVENNEETAEYEHLREAQLATLCLAGKVVAARGDAKDNPPIEDGSDLWRPIGKFVAD